MTNLGEIRQCAESFQKMLHDPDLSMLFQPLLDMLRELDDQGDARAPVESAMVSRPVTHKRRGRREP